MAPPDEVDMDTGATEALMRRLLSLSTDMFLKWGTDYADFASEATINGLFGWDDPLSDAIRTRYQDRDCLRQGLQTVVQQTSYVSEAFRRDAEDGLTAVRLYQDAEAGIEGGFR